MNFGSEKQLNLHCIYLFTVLNSITWPWNTMLRNPLFMSKAQRDPIPTVQILLPRSGCCCFAECWWELAMDGFSWAASTVWTSKGTSFSKIQWSTVALDAPLLPQWSNAALVSFSSHSHVEPLVM